MEYGVISQEQVWQLFCITKSLEEIGDTTRTVSLATGSTAAGSEPEEEPPVPLPPAGGLTYAQGPHVVYEKKFPVI